VEISKLKRGINMLSMVKNNKQGIYTKGEDYIYRVKFRVDNTPSDVTEADLMINTPCMKNSFITEMERLSESLYQGNYSIPTDAEYGEYEVEITAITGDATSKFTDSFIILPWNIIENIRKTSGIKECNDINNDDIALITWNAYLEARNDIFRTHIHELVNQCTYELEDEYYVRTHIVTEYTACDEDIISGHYINSMGNKKSATIIVTDAVNGKIKILDESGNSLPGDTCHIYVTYKTYSPSFTESLFKKAVIYLAAHEIIIRLHELDKATLADVRSNRETILANPNRMYENYKRICRKISVCKYDGVE